MWLLACFDLNQPLGFAALIGHQPEYRGFAQDAAQHIDTHRVSIGACAEHGVGIVDSGRFRPRQVVTILWRISHLRQVTGAAPVVFDHTEREVDLFQFIHTVINLIRRGTLFRSDGEAFIVHWLWVSGKRGVGLQAGIGQFFVNLEKWLNAIAAPAHCHMGRRVQIYQFFRAKQAAIVTDGFHRPFEQIPLLAVQDILLFRRQLELGYCIAGFGIRFGMARVGGKGEIGIGPDLTFKLMLFHWHIPILKNNIVCLLSLLQNSIIRHSGEGRNPVNQLLA